MSSLYDDSHRQLQREFDTERLADRIEQRLVRTALSAEDKAFIASLDLFFLATVNRKGEPSCSYRGGDPGFVRVLDERTLAFPNYDGNGMYLSMGNLLGNGKVGLLFIDLCNPQRLRVHGTARIAPADSISPPYEQAQFVVVVEVSEVFPNCSRYIHKYQLVERSRFVPHSGVETPTPGWKQADWAHDVLPRK